MANLIPEEKITEITHRADIAEVISEVVHLKKTGKNLMGLCPFHTEKAPSFTVTPEKQMFYCFGCGVGGGVIKFVEKHNGLPFVEAVKWLARRYGVELPAASVSPGQRKALKVKQRLFDLNHLAADYFHHTLKNSTLGEPARVYLQHRGISGAIADRFKIGFTPDRWNFLKRQLAVKNVDPHMAEKAGLLVVRKSGDGYYDRFRGRVIFPIMDMSRQVAGFGARVLDDGLPKYLNTPETVVFNKRRLLYGLCETHRICRQLDEVYVVEGYFDVISLVQHGIENVVATLGTALTADHVRALRGFARRLILVFDADAAGVKAAIRSSKFLLGQGIDARILVLPGESDPDAYIRDRGKEAFLQRASAARGIVTFLIESAVEKHGLSIEGKMRTISDLESPLREINDPVRRSLYIKALSERLGVDEQAIATRFAKTIQRRAQTLPRGTQTDDRQNSVRKDVEDSKIDPIVENKQSRLERQVVTMMLQYPQIIPEIQRRHLVERFDDSRLKALARLICERSDTQEPVSARDGWVQRIEDDRLQRLLAKLSVKQSYWDPEGCRRLIIQFETSRYRRKSAVLQRKVAEAGDDRELLDKLLKDKQKQARKRLLSSHNPQEV